VRLRSDIFVSAYIRQCGIDGVPAMLRRRGSAESGAIIVKVDRLDGTCALYGPAPQSSFDEASPERRFIRLHDAPTIPVPDAEDRLARELRFDTDLWIVEVEDRKGLSRLDEVAG
jgi:hypothetical protein